jgi:hypothetical protein
MPEMPDAVPQSLADNDGPVFKDLNFSKKSMPSSAPIRDPGTLAVVVVLDPGSPLRCARMTTRFDTEFQPLKTGTSLSAGALRMQAVGILKRSPSVT